MLEEPWVIKSTKKFVKSGVFLSRELNNFSSCRVNSGFQNQQKEKFRSKTDELHLPAFEATRKLFNSDAVNLNMGAYGVISKNSNLSKEMKKFENYKYMCESDVLHILLQK